MPDRPPQSNKLTKADIVNAIYEKTEMNRADVRNAVDLVFNEMKEALTRGQGIELRGFGMFEVKIRKARSRARNPKTGESLEIKSHGVVAFRSGRELKQAVWEISDTNKNNENNIDRKEE